MPYFNEDCCFIEAKSNNVPRERIEDIFIHYLDDFLKAARHPELKQLKILNILTACLENPSICPIFPLEVISGDLLIEMSQDFNQILFFKEISLTKVIWKMSQNQKGQKFLSEYITLMRAALNNPRIKEIFSNKEILIDFAINCYGGETVFADESIWDMSNIAPLDNKFPLNKFFRESKSLKNAPLFSKEAFWRIEVGATQKKRIAKRVDSFLLRGGFSLEFRLSSQEWRELLFSLYCFLKKFSKREKGIILDLFRKINEIQ